MPSASASKASARGFRPLPAGADPDFQDIASFVPELKCLPDGTPRLVRSRIVLGRVFIDTIPLQHEALQQILRDVPVDAVIADNAFLGVLPMLLGPRAQRPPVILCGTSILHWERADGAPNFAGLPPATTEAERREYAAIAQVRDVALEQPNVRRANAAPEGHGCPALAQEPVRIRDRARRRPSAAYGPGLRIPPRLAVLGAVHRRPAHRPEPGRRCRPGQMNWKASARWSWSAKARWRTTISACWSPRPWRLWPTSRICSSSSPRAAAPSKAIPGPLPANARLARYLPFEWLLPKVDVFVTNAGYGGVNQALSFGIPLVAAGLSEDKADVSVRVAWSGVGINLATDTPTPVALRAAVRTVLDTPDYRLHAARMADAFAAIDTRAEILRIVNQVAAKTASYIGMSPATVRRNGCGVAHHGFLAQLQSPSPGASARGDRM